MESEESNKRQGLTESELKETLEGLQHFAPLILLIAGLLMYVSLRIQHAMNPATMSEEVPELFLGLDIFLVMLFPYLAQVIALRGEERTPAQRVLAFLTGCGTAVAIATVSRALYLKEPLLPVVLEFMTGEIYWMLPCAVISAVLGSWWSARNRKRGIR